MQTQFTNSGNRKQAGIPIFAVGRVVGQVQGNIFHKVVSSKRHFLQKPEPSIAFDDASLKAVERAGALMVEVYDKDTQTTYRVSLQVILDKGKPLNRGFGPQTFLPLKYWNAHTKGAPVQAGLFGEE